MANGWTPERRARQAAAIRTWKPWERSSGPVTEAGKVASSQNAYRHGWYDRKTKAYRKQIFLLLEKCRMAINVVR